MSKNSISTRPRVELLESRELPAGAWDLALGFNDNGIGKVRYTPDGRNYSTFDAQAGLYYDASHATPAQELRVAVGDVNRDQVPDVIVANGPHYQASGSNSPAELRVFDGTTVTTNKPLLIARVTLPWLVGGAYLDTGDVDGDGYDDVVAGRDIDPGPAVMYPEVPNRVAIYSGHVLTVLGNKARPGAAFSGIEDPNWRGGTTVGVGDMDGDRQADVVVGVGRGGAPRVAV
jgi:hypothetical protein